jgi:hypothetical protein
LGISLWPAEEGLSNFLILTGVSKNTKVAVRYGAQTEEKYQYNEANVIFLPSSQLRESVVKRTKAFLGLYISMFSVYECSCTRLTSFILSVRLSTDSAMERRTMHTDCGYNQFKAS